LIGKKREGETVKQNQFKKWFQTKKNNKKNEDQFWNIKKLKRDEIEKAYQI
jgi:hypothetical protein